MYFVYILESQKDKRLYIGYTANLEERIALHKKRIVKATKHRLPLQLIYYEAYLNQADAKGRELFLKSGSGHRFIKKQLVHYLGNQIEQ